jgi:tetratricopeptide (TPR) repeat protein
MIYPKSILLLLVAMLLMIAGSAFGDRAFDYYYSGVNREDRGDWAGALADYTKAIELNPNYAFAYNNRGVVKKTNGDLTGALADENKAIELDPNIVEAWYNRGFVKRVKGDLEGALADETRAIELKPDFAQAWYNRGLVKHARGELGDALADFTKAIGLKANFAQAWYGCGAVKQAQGDPNGALVAYTKAIELDPKRAAVYHSRGCLHYDNHEFADALADFQKAIELDSSLDYSHFRVWLIMARMGEMRPATKELSDYLHSRKTGKPDDWESTIGGFLTGPMTEHAFLKVAVSKDKTKLEWKECQAYFYAGSKRLIEGDKRTAADYFQKCLDTDKRDFMEYKSAVAELKFLRRAE